MLEVLHLEGSRSEQILFSNLTFSVDPGRWIWIRGSNGSGKTTLLKILAGLVPTLGKILWKGKKVTRFEHSFLQELLYLGHTPALHPSLTPQENLQWFTALYPNSAQPSAQPHVMSRSKLGSIPPLSVPSTESMAFAIESLGLSLYQHSPCGQLSFGQCQRVALARLFLRPGGLWILDEPCTGIDQKGQQVLEKWLEMHLKQGGVAVVASHVPFNNIALPQHVVELKGNKI